MKLSTTVAIAPLMDSVQARTAASRIFIAATLRASARILIDACLCVEAVGADAGLAHVAVFGDDGAFDGGIDIGSSNTT